MIILDGKHISEFDLIVEDGTDIDEMPETRDLTVLIPDMPGEYDFGATLGPKSFNYPLTFIKSRDYAHLQQKKREFVRLLIDEYGRPRSFKLQKEYEIDKYYMVRYSGRMAIHRLINFGQFTLPLIAHDPYAYGEEQVRRSATNITRVINNTGHLVADSVIRIKSLEGQIQALDMGGEEAGNEEDNTALEDVVIMLNGERFDIEGAVDELVIDTKTMTVMDGNMHSLFDHFIGDITKFKLRAGNNNLRLSDRRNAFGVYEIRHKGRWAI